MCNTHAPCLGLHAATLSHAEEYAGRVYTRQDIPVQMKMMMYRKGKGRWEWGDPSGIACLQYSVYNVCLFIMCKFANV